MSNVRRLHDHFERATTTRTPRTNRQRSRQTSRRLHHHPLRRTPRPLGPTATPPRVSPTSIFQWLKDAMVAGAATDSCFSAKCCNEGDGIWCVLVFLLVSRLRNVEVQVQQWDSCSLLQKMESVAAMDAICVDECSADAVLVHVREAAMVGARLLSPPPPSPHSTTTGSHSNATTRIPHLHFSVVLSHPPFGPFTLSQSGALPNIPFLCLFPRRQQRLRL